MDEFRPTVPSGLRPVGRRLWHEVIRNFDLRPEELSILEAACRTRSDLDRLEQVLRESQTMISERGAEERAHPIFAEVRQHRMALARLLGQLGFFDATGTGFERSHAGRRLARLRWGSG